MNLREDYSDYCKKFNAVWKYLCSHSKSLDDIVDEVCNLRLYFDCKERWYNILSETGIAFVSEETCDYSKLKSDEFKDLGLFSKDSEYFLLNERYILPIRDMKGNIIALVGWYPDNKKYITTPSKYFFKDCLFFGLEQLDKTGLDKDYFIVEGIFDSLSIRSMGYNAVAQMGIYTSKVKTTLYGMFHRLVGVPDNDTQGRKVLKGDLWRLPGNASYLRWSGGFSSDDESVAIKDIDKLCNLYEEDSVKQLLGDCLKAKNRVIKIELS